MEAGGVTQPRKGSGTWEKVAEGYWRATPSSDDSELRRYLHRVNERSAERRTLKSQRWKSYSFNKDALTIKGHADQR